MFGFALNHVTLAKASFAELSITAEALQRVGIEIRPAGVWAFGSYAEPKKAETQSLTLHAVNCRIGTL